MTREKCDKCGIEYGIGDWPFCKGGHGRPIVGLLVIDDSYPGGKVLKNVTHEDITVYSRSEERIVLKQHGVVPFVRHVGSRGSDKNPHTQRFV